MLSKDQITESIEKLIALENAGKLIGEFKNIPDEVYHDPRCPGLSRSDLCYSREKSVGHLMAKKAGLIESKKGSALEFGSAFHKFILEPEDFKSKYADPFHIPKPDGDARKLASNGGCKEAYAIWKVEYDLYMDKVINEGKSIIDHDEMEKMVKMKHEMMSIPACYSILNNPEAEFENTYFFIDERTGRLMKYKPDIIIKSQKVMIDLKTAEDASPLSFSKAMANYYYDVQAGMYCYGSKTLFGGDWTFGFIVPEKNPPNAVALYSIGEAEKEVGMEIYKDSLDKITKYNPIEKCYGAEFSPSFLPSWAYTSAYR